jgi:hypothetical protein
MDRERSRRNRQCRQLSSGGLFLNIEGKAKATAAVPQPKPGVVKTYYKSQQIRVNSEWKASKKKKNALLDFGTTCCSLEVCVGSGKI